MVGHAVFRSLVLGAVIWGAMEGAALAQSSEQIVAPVGAELSEITVTARRERENLQSVPISVTAITAEDIREKNITGPEDFNTTVPGVTVAATSLDRASVTYTIRGQGQILGGPDPAVATYFNDVPTVVTSAGFLFDLENVEILKGPQGTLFGVNSTGGAVLFVPARPTNKFEGYIDVTDGNYAARRYQMMLNAPISDVLDIRFAADLNYRNGYTLNPVNGHDYDNVDYQAARLGVLFKPSDKLENYLLLSLSTLNEHGAGNECLAYNPNATFFAGAGDEAAACAAQKAYGARYVNAWIPPLGDFVRTRGYGADDTLTYQLTDDISIKNIFAYREYLYGQSYTNYGTPFPIYEYSLVPEWSAGLGVAAASKVTYSDELQLHGDSFGRRLHWQTGLYFDTTSPHSRDDIDIATYYSIAQVVYQSLNWKKGHAVYGQGSFVITDKLSITAGARYSEDLRRQLTTPLNSGGSSDLSAKFRAPTFNASAQYQFTPDVMAYLAIRRGYKSGGFNNVSDSGAQKFNPEYVTDFELGAKTEFGTGPIKARLNADVYRSKFTGWQERVTKIIDTPIGPEPIAIVTNVASGIVQGLDLDSTIIFGRHLEFSAFYSYVDPYFLSNTVEGVDYSKFPVANIVKHKVSGTLRYLLGVPASVGDMSVSTTYSWQAAKTGPLDLDFSTTADPLHGLTPAYGVWNARADWNSVLGSKVDLSAFCDNLTNKTYLSLVLNSWTLGQDTGQYGPPRMYGVEARWRF